ncbi:hypothetical protein J008_00561 [Cryptococcus neoformans]|nr:hypothetical protein C362_04763 [Cryptococcus neoformans var. grubii Bt1]OWZ68063.1 hypothetical protein AYX15_01076 [Cryptococcus neoformans var. grubii]OWZ80725.1 hypothetical protein C365_00549 [Cryptococcus neoformans var. grubii Bt85]OXG23175.1 hypothetical protein C366_00553 [Cryptococcus neoformans var. grubii Tu401-1]OXG35320.1 hypothetical protein C367_00559 [Cryptococcus neoformans var. grubii Ze90-1]OXM81582.1 hypothetical protein C364_00552 [Cryptococcus neoformans var. grubii B
MAQSSGDDNAWEERWAQGRTPFDQSAAHPAFARFLKSDIARDLGVPKSGKALVPGCGRGYDVHLLASTGLDAIGLDIAPTGVEAAKRWIGSQPSTSGKTDVLVQDFFAYDPPNKFDVIYDYTFLCALPPSLRPEWARQTTHLANIATNTNTILITLMFPLPPSAKSGGPPFALSEEIYEELLKDQGWKMVWSEDIEEPTRTVGAPGREKLAVWKRI